MKSKNVYIVSLILILSLLSIFIFGYNHIQNQNDYKQISGIKKFSSEDISDLSVLCKVWGFLKYYHPAVVEGKYNWDAELIKMLPSVLKAESQDKRNKIILEWVISMGQIEQGTLCEFSPDSVKMYPDLGWINNQTKLGKLSKELENIKTAKRSLSKSHYIFFNEYAKNPVFSNEDSYPEMSYPNASYRLLALFRYWNIIQYYFPYKYLIGENWDNVLIEFIPQFINAKNELEYKLTLLKLVARTHDSHAIIFDPIIEKFRGNYYVPFYVSFVDNKPVITDSMFNTIEKEYPLRIGDIILKVNGKSVKRIISEQSPYTSGSNYTCLLRNLSFNLLRSDTNFISVSFNRGDRIFSKKISCYPYPNDPAMFHNIFNKNKPLYQLLSKEKNIGYLYLGSSSGGVVPDYSNTKGLIIDLRCYPNGKKVYGYVDMQQLYEKPVKFAKFTSSIINQPGLFIYNKDCYTGDNKDVTLTKISKTVFYKGKVILLVNELTQSHAEFMAMFYRCSPNAVVIGSTTAGADGNISYIPLPGNIQTTMSGIGVYYPDGTETQRVGIVPDIVVTPTIKGIRDNHDEVLEKAISLIELSNFYKYY